MTMELPLYISLQPKIPIKFVYRKLAIDQKFQFHLSLAQVLSGGMTKAYIDILSVTSQFLSTAQRRAVVWNEVHSSITQLTEWSKIRTYCLMIDYEPHDLIT